MQRAAVGPATDILNNYVMARMMWNVSLDSQELTEEWLAGYDSLYNFNLSRICFSLLPSAPNYWSTVATCVCPTP